MRRSHRRHLRWQRLRSRHSRSARGHQRPDRAHHVHPRSTRSPPARRQSPSRGFVMNDTALTTSASPPSIDPLNRIEQGDCLDILRNISCESTGTTFDLAYLDPPFNTGETQRAAAGAYPDRWPTTADYLDFIRPRISEVIRLLKPNGSILLHCDWRTAHHLRLLLDELLGPERFINHLIWQYGLGGSSPRRFARKHDDILF